MIDYENMHFNQENNNEEITELDEATFDSTSTVSSPKATTRKNYVNYSDDDGNSQDSNKTIIITNNELEDDCDIEVDPCDRAGNNYLI